jgi:hypothetical protein
MATPQHHVETSSLGVALEAPAASPAGASPNTDTKLEMPMAPCAAAWFRTSELLARADRSELGIAQLAAAAGIDDAVRKIVERHMSGPLDRERAIQNAFGSDSRSVEHSGRWNNDVAGTAIEAYARARRAGRTETTANDVAAVVAEHLPVVVATANIAVELSAKVEALTRQQNAAFELLNSLPDRIDALRSPVNNAEPVAEPAPTVSEAINSKFEALTRQHEATLALLTDLPHRIEALRQPVDNAENVMDQPIRKSWSRSRGLGWAAGVIIALATTFAISLPTSVLPGGSARSDTVTKQPMSR